MTSGMILTLTCLTCGLLMTKRQFEGKEVFVCTRRGCFSYWIKSKRYFEVVIKKGMM